MKHDSNLPARNPAESSMGYIELIILIVAILAVVAVPFVWVETFLILFVSGMRDPSNIPHDLPHLLTDSFSLSLLLLPLIFTLVATIAYIYGKKRKRKSIWVTAFTAAVLQAIPLALSLLLIFQQLSY